MSIVLKEVALVSSNNLSNCSINNTMEKQRIEVRSHLEISQTVLIFIAGVALLCLSQNAWVSLLAAGVMLVSQIRMMFISHDIGHKILFNNDNYNRLWSILIGGISGSPIEARVEAIIFIIYIMAI